MDVRNRDHSVKTVISDVLVGAVKIYGASWLGLVVSFLPLYILRGLWPDDGGRDMAENILMAAVSFPATMVVVMLIYRMDRYAATADRKTTLIWSIGSSLICVILYPITKWKLFTSAGGYMLGSVFGVGKDDSPTVGAMLLAALIALVLYATAVFLGHVLARRRHEKERRKLLDEESKRHTS